MLWKLVTGPNPVKVKNNILNKMKKLLIRNINVWFGIEIPKDFVNMSSVIHGTKANPIQGKKNKSVQALRLW